MDPLSVNVDLLTQVASQTGHSYEEAYMVWEEYRQYPEVYSIVDTVLWIAQNQDIPVEDAIKVVRDIDEQFGSPNSPI